METPKYCPFCNSSDIIKSNNKDIGITFVHCEGCGAVVSFVDAKSEKETVEHWNRRYYDKFS